MQVKSNNLPSLRTRVASRKQEGRRSNRNDMLNFIILSNNKNWDAPWINGAGTSRTNCFVKKVDAGS